MSLIVALLVLGGAKFWNKRRTEDSAFSVFVDFSNGKLDVSGISSKALAWGFKLGYLRSTDLYFETEIGLPDHQESLSAGQWGMFSALSSLALSVSDNTLVLVDEPENGLHPAWQRTYLNNIKEAICGSKFCSVVVATHSPLILSSLPVAESDCIALKKKAGKVEAYHLDSPSGWDSNSILEEVFTLENSRGPDVTMLVNSALKLISDGVVRNKQKLKKLNAQLSKYQLSLPDEDVLKEVINSIVAASK